VQKGAFGQTTPDVLLAAALKGLVARTGVDPSLVGEVCVGNVLQAGAGAAGSRMAQLVAGIPHTVPLSAVNRQCSSGLQAVANVAAGLRAGHYDIGIGAGVESMSLTSMSSMKPQVDMNAVKGCSAARDCALPMGITSENVAEKFGISREAQDAFAAESHERAASAQASGRFAAEIVPVVITGPDGQRRTVLKDDGVRPGTSPASLAKLRPVFKPEGSTTAGNSSQLSDGAAAVLMSTAEAARRLGLEPMAIFRSYAVVGVPPAVMGIGPAVAIPAALAKAGVDKSEVDVFEINEAFASQASYCVKELGLDPRKVNPNGGAIALGHPLGCTGARQIATLVHELRRRGGGIGVVSMCVGTGMGASAVIEVLPPSHGSRRSRL
jgi:acetyl-CoA acyltransferase 1